MHGPGETITPLRVMTFNILFETDRASCGAWEERRPLVSRIIREWEPDVLGLQEAMEGQLADLQADFPELEIVPGERTGQSRMPFWAATVTPALAGGAWALRRSAAGAGSAPVAALSNALLLAAAVPAVMAVNGYVKNGRALLLGSYSPILFRKDRFRLLRHGCVVMSESPANPASFVLGTWLPRIANWVELEPLEGGVPFTVYNAHLDWMPWGPETSGRKLRAHIDDHWTGAPQILMGDFNGDLDCDACRELLRPGPGGAPPVAQDAWETAARRSGPANTCEGVGTCPDRTDHILFRSGFGAERVVTVTFPQDKPAPSDHYPVVADLVPMHRPSPEARGVPAAVSAARG